MGEREERIRRRLLAWYRQRQRDLPWRRTRDPYRIWVSEIMLQQTTVATATPYWLRFVERFPTVEALARANRDDVLAAWSGLGYYGRAKRLHQAAGEVAAAGEALPNTAAGWRELPGVGEYTAAAVASIAFGEPVAAIDGNVSRVLARLDRIPGDPRRSEGKQRLREVADRLLDREHPGEFNQAMMELGAQVCRPRAPDCEGCPVAADCQARLHGEQERFPARAERRSPVSVVRAAFHLTDQGGRILLARVPEGEPNEGMWELPAATVHHGGRAEELPPPGVAGGELASQAADRLRAETGLRVVPGGRLGRIRHAITHHRITVYLFAARGFGPVPAGPGWAWAGLAEAEELPLTSAGRQLLALCTGEADRSAG